jgi:hypothetical protein
LAKHAIANLIVDAGSAPLECLKHSISWETLHN